MNQAVRISFVPDHTTSVCTAMRLIKPKKTFSNTGTQTDQPCCSPNKELPLMVQQKSSVDVNMPTFQNSSFTQTYKNIVPFVERFPPSTSSSLMQRDECCSTNDCSIVMEEDKEESSEIDVSCKHTQTAEFLQDRFHENFDVDFTIDTEDFKELTHSQTQTNWELAFDNFPLFEDNETQTLESYLELDSSTIDCATQTKTILDDILSVDNQTQTLLPAINFDDFENIHCGTSMDEQTQTLPWTNFTTVDTSSLDILQTSTNSSMDCQTQTLPSTNFDGNLGILRTSSGSSTCTDIQTQTLPLINFDDSETSNAQTQTTLNTQSCFFKNIQ